MSFPHTPSRRGPRLATQAIGFARIEGLEGRLLLALAPYPNPAVPAPIPGTVQVENFDSGGEGVAYHDSEAANLGGKYRPAERVDIENTTDAGGGYDVGYTHTGEWMKFTVKVSTAQNYDLQFRVASPTAGGKFHLEVDGNNKTGTLTIPATGGWQAWQTLSKNGVALPAGQHVVTLAFETNNSSGFVGNFNWMSFTASPKPGNLDTTFGTGGKVTADWGGADQGTQVEALLDGKFLVAGRSGKDFVLARYNANGSPDTTFGTNGRTTIACPPLTSVISGRDPIAVLPDGKIMAALSYKTATGSSVKLARFNYNGVLDTTFTFNTQLPNTGVEDLAGQTDGKIVAACTRGDDVLVVRFNTNGAIDTGFGVNGQVIRNYGMEDMHPRVAIDHNDKIVFICMGNTSSDWELGRCRLNGNGTYDNTFAKTLEMYPRPSSDTTIEDIAIDSSNRTVIAGRTDYSGGMYAVRLGTNGQLDTSFSSDGMAVPQFTNQLVDNAGATSVAIVNDQILLAGYCTWLTKQQFGMVRLNSNGALDTTFGASGRAITDMGGSGTTALGMAVRADGNIILAGQTGGNVAIARYLGVKPTPSQFRSAVFPGVIQAENFDDGGEGISYHDVSTFNEGGKYRYSGVDMEGVGASDYAVSFTKPGEWLRYTLYCPMAKAYVLTATVAAASTGGKFHLELDGASLGAGVVPNTGNWQTYASVGAGVSYITAGWHTLKLVMDTAGSSGYVGNFSLIMAT